MMLNLHFITVGSFVGSICKQISLTLRYIADEVSVHCRRRHRLRTFFPVSKKTLPTAKCLPGVSCVLKMAAWDLFDQFRHFAGREQVASRAEVLEIGDAVVSRRLGLLGLLAGAL